jgi:acyl-CoA reductase-like NAD-dependent aldehyde dehydrogenase
METTEILGLKTAQNELFNSGKTKPYAFRVESLKKLDASIRSYEPQIIKALAQDLRKSETESYLSEIAFLSEEIRFALKHLKKWMKPKRVSTPITQWPGKSYLYSEPLGSVLIIAPWNYPFQLVMSPLIGAIAAGNCAVLKPSELSIHTSQLIEEIISKTFPKEYVAVVLGGVETSQALVTQPWDHLFFTGGTEVGRKVMMEAAKTLTPVTLELGGKSPCIVDSDTDWEVTAKRIVWGKFFNAGQTCVAPDYVLLPKGATEKFNARLESTIERFFSNNPESSPDYGRIVSQGHYERLKKYLSRGKIALGGICKDEERFIAPTVLTEVSWQDDVMKEEIFGPILPVIEYDSLDEAILKIQSRPKPLALYFFSKNEETTRKVLNRLSFGGGCINDTLVHLANPKLPFGGVGQSGMGRYHGKYSFDSFSHEKSVVKRSFWLDLALRYPPYLGSLKIMKLFMR